MPLGIDVTDSDLDVICQAADLDGFDARARALYGDRSDFAVDRRTVRSGPAVVARFTAGGERIELFAQRIPVGQQDAYRHMEVEWRLLQLAGSALGARIVAQKQRGTKTEPAFAAALGLAGDPYVALLDLSARDDDDLRQMIKRAKLRTADG